ncbi:hypothetical protein [Halorhodospira abdelmalekii]|uniref:hypothetical protein n=1 Tax=Halorhodospira abdelmalekii TaxID=421629 RepID=UPI00190447E6|nr:hypothetical protein [Halorhodospira abdelmalekii]
MVPLPALIPRRALREASDARALVRAYGNWTANSYGGGRFDMVFVRDREFTEGVTEFDGLSYDLTDRQPQLRL